MLDFRMETFLSVCECLNYTRAAEKLNITQPAVSQHIRYLEEEYQTKLFVQKGKRVELTESGDRLRHAVLSMQHDILHLKKELSEQSGQKKKLCFGATLTIGQHIVPGRLPYLKEKYPGVSMEVWVDNTRELLQRLNKGALEFAIVEGNFPKHDYDYEQYKKEDFIPVCAKKYDFAQEPHSLEDLLSETLIIREAVSGNREMVERMLQGRNLSLEDFAGTIEINDIQAIKELIKNGMGIGFLYRSAVEKELLEGSIRELSLADFQIKHDMVFVWMKNSVFAEYYRECARLLRPTN